MECQLNFSKHYVFFKSIVFILCVLFPKSFMHEKEEKKGGKETES